MIDTLPSRHSDKRVVIHEMQRIAPQCREIDCQTTARLGELTDRLLGIEGEEAEREYERYVDIGKRDLNLDYERLEEQFAGETVVVVGGTGLIGSSIIPTIQALSPSRIVSISRGEIRPVQLHEGVEYVHCNIRDRRKLEEVMMGIRPRNVLHFASDKYNEPAELHPIDTLTTNIYGTQNVIDASRAAGVKRLVYASTGKTSAPFAREIYAFSKKVAEWLMAKAATEGGLECGAVRFTHVVDSSNVLRMIFERTDRGEIMRLQGPDKFFYGQSAIESGQLTLQGIMETEPGILKVQAIRNLEMPIDLTDLALGVMTKRKKSVPIRFLPDLDGHEGQPWPGTFNHLTGDFSPLFSSLETWEATASGYCPEIDTFPLKFAKSNVGDHLKELQDACREGRPGQVIREISYRLSCEMLRARIGALSDEFLKETVDRIDRLPYSGSLNCDHERINQEFKEGLERRLNR